MFYQITKKCLPGLVFLIISTFSTSAQTYYFDNYGVAEGLYQSKVFDILQDKEHYVWLGTLGGASRFDGKEFVNFTAQNGLAQNGVQVLYKDSRGIIWYGHLGGGISRFVNNKFEIYQQSGSLIKSDITDIVEDKLHRIWISTYGSGTYCIKNPAESPKEMKFEQFKGNKLSDLIFNISVGQDSSLYFITDVGIKKYKYSVNSFESFQPEGLTKYFTITCMFEDDKNNFWFGTYHGGLYKYTSSKKAFKIFDLRDGLASNWITTINEDAKGNIWLGSWGAGLTRIDKSDNIKIFNSSNGLQDDKIKCMFEDSEGNMLFGTNEHGLSIFKGEQFITFSEKDGIGNPQIWAITQDVKGRFWFGTNNGLSVYDPKLPSKKQFVYYNQDNKNISNQVRFLSQDNDNNIWLGTIDQGVMQYITGKEKFIYEAAINAYMPNAAATTTALAVDKKNNVWIGTLDRLLKFNISKREITPIGQTDGLQGNEISALYADSKNVIWVGIKGKGINSIKDTTIKSYSLGSSVTPTCITEDKEGNIWVGTMGQGVMVLKNGKVIRTITEQDGLLTNLINLLIFGDDNCIYIGTNKGLNKYNPKSNNIINYTRRNGFTGIETKSNSAFKDKEGNIWVGTVNGVTKLNTHLTEDNNSEPSILISKLRVNLKEVPVKQGMTFGYKENGLIIDYHSISLTNPEAVKYQIMLDGADKDWQPITDQSSVTYSALPPKSYIFKVRARNSFGVWNKEPITFAFTINPPFYQTWWFIMICIFTGSGAIYFFIKRREQNLVKEKQVLETKVSERTAELNIKNEELGRKNKDITDSIRYAQRIQFAILPPSVPYKDTFVLFKPKDIVSGDFYWFHDEPIEFLAAVDCTGHGVPGAFMSIIGHIILNKIVKEYKIYRPSEILDLLNKELTNTLHSQLDPSSNVADGMDLSLINYNPETNTVQFAGAFNSLYHVSNGEVNEHQADRFSIGRNTGPDMKFTNHEFIVNKGDMVYLCSDGYEDQFGGPNGKKFKRKQLLQLFQSIASYDADKQKEIIEKTFEDWKDNVEQIDDVLVIGRKF